MKAVFVQQLEAHSVRKEALRYELSNEFSLRFLDKCGSNYTKLNCLMKVYGLQMDTLSISAYLWRGFEVESKLHRHIQMEQLIVLSN